MCLIKCTTQNEKSVPFHSIIFVCSGSAAFTDLPSFRLRKGIDRRIDAGPSQLRSRERFLVLFPFIQYHLDRSLTYNLLNIGVEIGHWGQTKRDNLTIDL